MQKGNRLPDFLFLRITSSTPHLVKTFPARITFSLLLHKFRGITTVNEQLSFALSGFDKLKGVSLQLGGFIDRIIVYID
ncbi:hypothetical protein H9649_05485 [Sporosarcina sp. Sa2YVA2]|uniref:Uncharacterized protein n=1 Tax=Sporosarcina quadrami TaxID=2762234 RepID=A0ABR8U7L1_9BACL|nr:hypothetical protein [Sporosarcina quadrami]MBD7984023.1 hypothetical protein [Sporosarcina quadrami]